MNIIQLLNSVEEKEARYNEELHQSYSDIMDMLSKKISKYESIDIGDNHDYRSVDDSYLDLGDPHDISFEDMFDMGERQRRARDRHKFANMVAKDLPFNCEVHKYPYIDGLFALIVRRNNGTITMIPVKPYHDVYYEGQDDYHNILNDIIKTLVIG